MISWRRFTQCFQPTVCFDIYRWPLILDIPFYSCPTSLLPSTRLAIIWRLGNTLLYLLTWTNRSLPEPSVLPATSASLLSAFLALLHQPRRLSTGFQYEVLHGSAPKLWYNLPPIPVSDLLLQLRLDFWLVFEAMSMVLMGLILFHMCPANKNIL